MKTPGKEISSYKPPCLNCLVLLLSEGCTGKYEIVNGMDDGRQSLLPPYGPKFDYEMSPGMGSPFMVTMPMRYLAACKDHPSDIRTSSPSLRFATTTTFAEQVVGLGICLAYPAKICCSRFSPHPP